MSGPYTNFALMTTEQLTIWQRTVWKQARKAMFVSRFMGKGPMSMIQRVTELKKDQKGARAVMTLVADLEGDGTAGDRTLEGNEERMKAYDQVIRLDQLRHANKHEGTMADMKSVVEFRENSHDVLAYWLADRWDQLAFLTLSGVPYSMTTDGATRTGSDFPLLEFAADVTSPSTNRHYRWDENGASSALLAGDTTAVAANDLPSWKMLVQMKARAVRQQIKPIRGEGGTRQYNVFMSPEGCAALKLDADFLAAWRHAQQRSKDNPLFVGADVIYVDGLAIMEFEHVYNTRGAASGSKWGGGSIEGQRVLMCGAQALGIADIGQPRWIEKGFDYENQQGISIAKIGGFKKPVFRSNVTRTVEDFSVICVDTAI